MKRALLLSVFVATFTGCAPGVLDYPGVDTGTAVSDAPWADDSFTLQENPMVATWVLSEWGGAYVGAYLQGRTLWIGLEGGLIRFDVSDPRHPTFLSSFALPGGIVPRHIEGDLLYGSASNGTLVIADISDPASPTIVGRYLRLPTTSGPGYDNFALFEGKAYFSSENGVHVLDVSDPTAPTFVTEFGPSYAYLLRVDDILWVGSPGSQLEAYRLTSGTPTLLAEWPTWCGATSLSSSGDALVWQDCSGVHRMAGIQDPATATDAVILPDAMGPRLEGTTLWYYSAIGASELRLRAADLATPTTLLVDVHVPIAAGADVLVDDVWLGTVLVAVQPESGAFGVGVGAIDTRVPPREALTVDVTTVGEAIELDQLTVVDAMAYVAGVATPRFGVVDLSSGQVLRRDTKPVASIGWNGADGLVLAKGPDGFELQDISAPGAPQLLGRQDPGSVDDAVWVGSAVLFAGEASGTTGLHALDVSDPANPVAAASLEEIGPVSKLAVSSETLYAVTGYGDFLTFDIADPLAPSPLGSVSLLSYTSFGLHDVASDGTVAVVCDATGVSILDVRDPASPSRAGTFAAHSQVGRYDDPMLVISTSGGCALDGTVTWVGDRGVGLTAIDHGDLNHLDVIGRWEFADGASDVHPRGSDVLFTSYDGRIGSFPKHGFPRLTGAPSAAAPGDTLEWTFTWTDRTTADPDVRCVVLHGACAVSNVDYASNTATITYTLPMLRGEHHLAVAVGEAYWYEAAHAYVQAGM